MLTPLLTGAAFGLAAGLAPGPLQTLAVSETLRHGRWSGIRVGLAPLLSDIPIVTATVLLLDRMSDADSLLGVLAFLGASFLVYLAVENFRAQPVASAAASAAPRSLRKGVLTNLLSPHPYLFWLTVGAPFMLATARDDLGGAAAFVGGFYVALIGCFAGLVLLVGQARARLTERPYLLVVRLLGVVLLVFAALLVREGLVRLGFV